jgi:hypothetical protein
VTAAAAPGGETVAAPRGRSLQDRYDRVVAAEFAAQPLAPATAPLTSGDLAGLPAPVKRYVERSGALGRPAPQNMRVVFDADMYRSPGRAPMRSTAVQHTFFGRPARLFLMKARMFGLPVRALHVYREERATFQVRAAGLVTVVDLAGDEISRAETVTVLNDLCVYAPGLLVDPRLAWVPIDDRSAAVTFSNGPWRVAATVVFNERDELVDFWSDDRPEGSDGKIVPRRWNTPISDYREVDGMRLPMRGAAAYARPDGPFTYGEFTVRSIAYDVVNARPAGPEART